MSLAKFIVNRHMPLPLVDIVNPNLLRCGSIGHLKRF